MSWCTATTRRSEGGRSRSPFIAVWKSDLVGSDIDPLHGVLGERAANHGWGPWFLRNLALRRHHPIYPGNTSPVTDPKRTAKPDQRHKIGRAHV